MKGNARFPSTAGISVFFVSKGASLKSTVVVVQVSKMAITTIEVEASRTRAMKLLVIKVTEDVGRHLAQAW